MSKDICHYYDSSVEKVFDAYLRTSKDLFKKDCDSIPYHKISFSLSSFKYNITAGACTVHCMPYGKGTAVCVRYTIVRSPATGLFGARYKAHDKDYTCAVEEILETKSQVIEIKMNEFLKLENQVTPQNPNPKAQGATVVAQSGADEIKKYKELLDSGIITQEEFDAKKKQILGL